MKTYDVDPEIEKLRRALEQEEAQKKVSEARQLLVENSTLLVFVLLIIFAFFKALSRLP